MAFMEMRKLRKRTGLGGKSSFRHVQFEVTSRHSKKGKWADICVVLEFTRKTCFRITNLGDSVIQMVTEAMGVWALTSQHLWT